MSITKSNHCAYDTHYHVVFPVKYHKVLLYPHVTSAIQEIARDISERYDITFEQMGTDGDHTHILCSFHPKISGVEMVGTFKSITAIQVFKRFPELRKELWGGEFWSDGYYLATVSEHGNWKVVEQYVKNQGKTTGKDYQLELWH